MWYERSGPLAFVANWLLDASNFWRVEPRQE